MAAVLTLHLSAGRAVLLREQRGRLALAGIVERSGDDTDASRRLRELLRRFSKDRVVVVVDVVEEELVVESLPVVGGRDLGALVARRLEHRRERRLLAWDAARRPLGWRALKREADERMPVRIGLLASDAPSQLWLQAAIAAGARIDRVVSPGLLAAEIGARIGGDRDGLLVTVGPAGIRQTLVSGGHARFTRLAQLFDATPRVESILAECARTLQYLLMNQLVKRDAVANDRLRLWLVADGIVADRAPPPASLLVDSASSIKVQTLLAADLGAPRAEQALPAMLGAVPLWCDRRLAAHLSRGYETADARRPLLVARMQRAILAAAGGLATASVVGLGVVEAMMLVDAANAAKTTNALQQQSEARLSQAIARFPLGGPDMRRLVDADRALQARRLTLPAMLVPVAEAMQRSPTIRLERLGWQRPSMAPTASTGASPAASAPVDPALAALNGDVPGGPGDPGGTAGADASTPAGAVDLTIEASVRLPATKLHANRTAERFAAAIAVACRCEAVVTSPPYDPDVTSAFSSQVEGERTGAAGDARTDSVAPFTVRMRRPVPTVATPRGAPHAG